MCCVCVFFCQAEDGIRDLVRSRGLGDVYKRQGSLWGTFGDTNLRDVPVPGDYDGDNKADLAVFRIANAEWYVRNSATGKGVLWACLLYTSDAADERSSVDLGGRRIIKKKIEEKRYEEN